jgi:N-terminal 7TM region of histidine kinase
MEKYFFFSGLFNAVVSILFGLFIFLKNRKSKVNQTFALFCLAVAAWSFAYMFWPIASSKDETLFWFQLLHIGASFTSIAYLHFVVTWLGLYKKNKGIIFIGYLLAIFFSLFVFSSYFIVDMVPKFSMKFWAEPGILYHFYLVYFFGYFIYSFYILFSNYKKHSGIKRAQIKLMLTGAVIAFLGGSTNYLLWYDINFPPFGNILVVSYVILSAYAIIVYRFMDIRIVFRKSTVLLFSFVSIIIPAIITSYLLKILIPNFNQEIIYLAVFIASLAIFPFLKRKYYHLANKYFFTSLYDSRELIAKMSEELRSTLDVDKIYDFIHQSLRDAFYPKMFAILGYNKKTKIYFIQYNKGFKIGNEANFPANDFLYKVFTKNNKPIITEELKAKYQNACTKSIIELLTKLEVEVLSPLNIKSRTVGLIALGPKESGDMYNSDDLKVLKTIGAFVAIAIEHALQYKNIVNLNTKLKKLNAAEREKKDGLEEG